MMIAIIILVIIAMIASWKYGYNTGYLDAKTEEVKKKLTNE